MPALNHLISAGLLSLWSVRRVVGRASRLRLVFTVLFTLGLLVGLWLVFLHGFRFLDTLGGVGLLVVHRLFTVFFFGLGIMLVLSGMITAYACFFHSREMPFLLLQPIPHGQVTLYKFLEASLLSSWAFFFIIIPFVGAYAMHERLSPLFTVWTFFFSLPFALLSAGVGVFLTVGLVRWLPRRLYPALIIATVAGLALVALRATLGAKAAAGEGVDVILTQLVPGLRVALQPFWPSWWLAEGIMAMTRGQLSRGGMLLAVLVANLALLAVVVEGLGGAWLYDAWQRTLSSSSRDRRSRRTLVALERILFFVPRELRVLFIKDIRVFLRDPIQWSQALVFFGILAVYFINLRNLQYHVLAPHWRSLIAFLNVFSVSAVMCSFGARFIFPQLSLEGQGFWVLHRSPVTLGRVLSAKFCLALCAMLFVSMGLMIISVEMLEVWPVLRWSSLALALAMSLAISGLSTGLGAVYMDLRQQNPAAILSGFGGTLNLVLSLAFMCAVIFPFASVFHAFYLERIGVQTLRYSLLLSSLWLLTATAVATLVPLWLGHRSLLAREY